MKHESVHAFFSRIASELPSKTAIEVGPRAVSYAELEEKSNSLANFLLANGASAGAPVAVLTEDRLEILTAVLGILKAGCVFAPLDPKIPEKRLEAMMSLLSPQWFITESQFLRNVNGLLKETGNKARVICFDAKDEVDACCLDHVQVLRDYATYFNPAKPVVASQPDDPCYVYFTSGSTGQPKAIAGRLKGIDHFIRWEIKTLGLDADTRVSQMLPPSFDGSLRDMFIPLCTGGTACAPAERETVLETGKLIEWLDEQRISVIHCVPSLFRSLLNEPLTDENFKSLKYILMAGEPLLPSDVKRWTDIFGERIQLINLYGTSETTMAKFAYFVKPSDQQRRSIPVGKPIEGAAAVVVDKRGRPCAAGIIGEIYIRTPYRALGYYNQPELTREAFIQNPFNSDPNDIVYKTGDLGRVLEDGNFEYLGRLDRQVKIRGNRVELSEIEDVLRGHVAVTDVAVIDREDSAGHNYLCAYVVLGSEVETDALRELVLNHLPDYMVPSAFIVMDALPRTISGKIDRQALPVPGRTRSGMQEYVAPSTDVEKTLVGIWTEVLGIDQVGINDNFFQLGGHSLRATQILTRVRAALNVEVPLRSLFETPTVAAIATIIEAKLSLTALETDRISVSRPELLPLSFAQQRLWFFDQLEPGSSAYNLPVAVRLNGQLDADALERTFSEIIRRHESLRTTFSVIDNSPVQVISDSCGIPLTFIDLSALAEHERETEARMLVERESSRPFDLSRGPLLRTDLIKLSEQEHIVSLTMHHIISDGWSMSVLIREVVALYEAYTKGEESPLAELTVQYADYSVWQREHLQGEVLEGELNYWREQLTGAPRTLELPTDRQRPVRQSHQGARLAFEIDEDLSAKLRDLSQREGVTLFMLLLAAWQLLLSRYSGQQDIVVGAAIANRNRADIENLIGFFVNTLALRVRVNADEDFLQLLARVREVTLEGYKHQDLPFERVVEEVQPDRQTGSQPLFQVMFVYQNMPASSHELPGLTLGQVEMNDDAAVRSDIDFYLWEGESLRGSFIYSTDLFDESTIAQMSSRLLELLREITSAPETVLTDLLVSAKPEPLALPFVATDDEKAPFSYHQERLWFIDQFENGNVYESAPTYHNIPLILHLDGEIDADVLESSLNAIVQRHAVLRTRFISDEGHGCQVITPSERLELKVVQCADFNEAMDLALNEAQQSFALDEDLPIRATLLRLSVTESLLLLTVHHIVADRQSLQLISAELAEIYNAQIEERSPSLPELPIQYAHYASGQQNLTDSDLEQLWFYWKWQLRGQLAALKLPEERPRPAIHTYTAARETITLQASVVNGFAGEDQSAAMLAAFKVLMRRYSRQDEIVFGTSEPCRTQSEIANLVGPFSNLVVLRSDLGGNPSFTTLVSRLQKTLAQAQAHQEMPFDKLVQLLNPEKDMSRTALFDVLFQFDNEAAPVFSLGQTQAQQIDTNFGYGKYDLNLLVRRSAEGFTVTAVYNSDIYDAWNIRQMLRHFQVVINEFANDPEQNIDDITLLSEAEEQQQLSGWNNTGASYPAEKTIHQLFAEQVSRSADEIAITFGDEQLIYRQLDERANRLAHYLQGKGVGPNKLVALCLTKSPEMIVSLLAVLKAGGAYLPLDPTNPAERLQFVMEDSGAAHLITTSALASNIPTKVPATVLLDVDSEAIASQPSTAPITQVSPNDLAYCIYTSGSTGKPKGALIEHKNVVRLMVNDQLQFTFTADDVWTMFHSYSFDFSVWEMYGALLYGGRLVIVPEQISKDPALFFDLVIDEQVTVLNQTPTAFYNFASLDQGQNLALRYVIFGGEALRPALLREWKAARPEVKLINMYGITETTVHVTFKEIDDDHISNDTSNIGVPIPTTTTYIFDDELRLMPVGVPGEICVGGGGVCRGYLGRDELTRRKFVANPYRPEETVYRSGDLGKLLPSGEMVYMGRSDDQVQIRGFRVEPGEVQSQLLTHPSIARAEVIAKTMHHGAVELVAYVVASGNVDVTELRTHVASALPHYMVPSAFVFIDEFPLTPNGKIDRRALPEPDQMRPELGAAFVAPSTPTEEILASIWSEVLGLARVGVQDSFFELGGHSLLATQVTSRIRTVFNLELPLRNLFERPTVAELAREIDAMTAVSRQDSAPPMVRVSREEPLPLSFAQQRLWFLNQLEPDSAAYNMHTSLRITGPLNLAAFEQTITEIIRRHEILRTVFITREGEPFQVVTADERQVLSIVDLRNGDDRETEARQLATEESRRPFDLSQGPLLRMTLMRLSEEEHIVAFTMHHIISDGWSMGLLIKEMTALYESFSRNESSPLPELSMQYADFATWQRQWLQGPVLDSQLAYWKKKLAGAQTMLELPTDRPRPAAQSYRGATTTLTLSESLSDSLKELTKAEGATLFMTLLAAFNILLQRYTNQQDILVGTDVANRNRSETEPLLGFFINQLVLRTDLSGDPTFRELLGRVREMALEAYAYQDLPFEKLVEALQPERHLSRSPLFQTKLVLQNVPTGAFELRDLTLRHLEIENNTSRIDLTLAIKDGGDYLSGSLEYSTELFDESTVKRMLAHYTTLLESIAADPEQRISDLSFLDEGELSQLLAQATGAKADYPKDKCIHELFAAQVEQTPDAVAVIFEGQRLTYAELNERANQLANYLRELGVQEEMLVGVCARRSVEMVVAMLGILKAGAAYLPLDPSYPLERIAFMLDDAQVAVLLTQEELLESLPSHWAQVVCLDSDADLIEGQSSDEPFVNTNPENLAYVIYTSGSTGKPKGVMVQHAGLCNMVKAQIKEFEIEPDSRVLQFASSSFDASVSEIFTAFVAGATLVLGRQESLMPGGDLEQLLREQKVTTSTFPPTVLRVLNEEEFEDLKVVVAAGESLDKETAERWRKRSNGGKLIDAYGPTEATVCATMGQVRGETVSIGVPIENGEVYILDERMQVVPTGVIGELYVGGAGIARGYLNRPELTSEKFVPNPFGSGRLYRTGDLGRWLASGEIEFLGRIDHQVKVRGYRIETGEIESMLNNHPEIMSSLVIAREDVPGEKQLVAYCVPQQSERTASSGNARMELWPSVAEFYIYDDLLYQAMTDDSLRNESYKVAINEHVPGKVVLDIGTGKDAILSRFCVEAGAAKVYAIELLEETYLKAKATIESLGLQDKITLINGNSMEIELPEKIDVCVSEIVGPIGGSEGATQIINNAWRFMKPDGVMIPERSLTKIAAITLPEDFLANPGFTSVSAQYVDKVFQQIGHRFDLRLCMRNFSKANIISNSQAFEDLDFSQQIEPEYRQNLDLVVARDENLVGFVVWLNLYTVAHEVIDILEGEYCWLPVYLPVFYPGVEVREGDRITGSVVGRFSDNNLNLDYTVSGTVHRQSGESVDFEYTTYHHEAVFQATEFHKKIFPDGGINTLTSEQPKVLARNLKTYLKDFLPDYMVPSAFVMMDAFPLSPNGKVDRRALPPPENARPETERMFVAPRNATEELLAGIWSEVLRVPEVGIHDNFFELGGDSILSIQIITRANRVGLQLTTKQIFQYQTIAELAVRAGSSEAEEAILDDGVRESFSMISPEDRARVPEGIEDAYPLAMMQAGMIFHSEFTPEAPLYHSINTFTLRAPFDAEALVQAVSDLAAIHEVMRTSVDLVSFSEPLQLVHEHVDVPVGVTDLRHLNGAGQEEVIARWLEEEKHNFSWGEVPMVRFHLHRRTDETFQFTFTAHHAIFDGWSDGLFLTELFRHYLSLIKDKTAGTTTAVLEPPVSRFRDFVALERATLASPEARKYWQELLSESKPTRVPRWPREQVNNDQSSQIEEVGSGVVNTIEMTLDVSVSEGLRQLARRSSVPLKSVLLAAHLRVMSLISGERDVVTGLVSNGRPETVDGERVIGMFLNSLPIRVSLDGGTWEDLVTKTFKAERELLPYRRYPLSQIQRENGNRALFETCFNYVHFHVLEGVASLNDVQVLSTGGEADTNFTLMVDFNLRTQGHEIDVVVACDESKIVPAQAKLIAGYYKRTLEMMAAASAEEYKQHSVLSETEQRKLLVEFNETALSYADVEGMHRLFEAQASRTPDATALVVGDESLTYSELNNRANQLAHQLQTFGVNAEQRVGILLERSPAMILSVLAVLKAGGCYVPLDSNAPAERLSYMMADAGLQALLTTGVLANSLPAGEHAFAVVHVDEWELDQEADENTNNLSTEVSGQQLAYITYTSGSTGRPKGVMVSHGSAINAYRGWEQAYELHSTSSHLQMANFAFDVFTGDLMRALFSGCKLVVCPTEFLLDPPALYALMLREGVDCAEFTPAVLRNLVQHLEETGQRLDFMRLLAAGSDTWYVREYNQIKQLCAESTRVINSYGVTEASIDSTYFESARLNLPDENLTPIGRPFANVTTYVLDADQQLAPIGTVGELYLGGAGLARGYWARPELTATKFIPDSFSETGGGRLYRTGDLARYLENGELEFLGRADNQVKVRGYRIELGEIESELRQHEAVQEAVVVARADAGEATRLVAYVVSAAAISSAELRDRLRQRLPEYMVPSAFMQLSELPLTPNGKVDRKALPEPERVTSESARYVAARTPLEELIAGIWMEVLGLEKVSTQENFFELGGHSLLATRVISRVRALGQVELPLRTLFESPTVAGLARRVEEAQRSQRGQTVVARIEPVERRKSGLPLSFAQQRLWFLDQLEAGSAAYNIPAALRLRGELDQEALARTLTEIVRRHEVLRTSFTTRDGEPVQLIAAPEALALPVEDLSQLADAEAAARRLTEEEAQKPFDLQYGPMLRARLLRLAEQDHVLLLTMHHIVSDGWSTGVLLREAQLLYGAYSQGRPSPLHALPIQYGDFSVWQREWLSGAVLEEQLNYWREQLQDAPAVLNLPTDLARPAVQSFRGSLETRLLSAELTDSLRKLSQTASTTLYMTLLASFQTLLSRYTGQQDIVVGTPVANRTRVELEDLIGFFVNTLVMRANLSDDPTFIELLNQTRETCLEAYLHQDLPFEKLVEELAPERSLSYTPIFQAMFVMQNEDGDEARVADAVAASGLELQEVPSEQRTAKFDLTLVIEEKVAGLGASLEYNTDLFKGETMARMLEQFERLLQSIVSEPQTVVSQLTMLTPSEEQKLRIDWNNTARDYQITGGMHRMFEAQVERTPSATALVFEDKRFTYSELNERANTLAHHLREIGVSTEDRVGILIDRSPAMIVSLLAVLKAGGCYVPLDPQYPQERLEFMKADAGLRVLLTTRVLADTRGLDESGVVCVDEVESDNRQNPNVEVSEQQLAYLIYTSGSTGVPKGVAITHGNATTFIHWASEIFDQRALSGVLFSTSICFDLSIFELFVTLSNGGKVILAQNALQLPELAAAKQVTLINTVPSAMAELVRIGAVPDSVKVINLAGEALSKELVAEIYASTNVETVYNLYGPSEDTTYSTFTSTTPGEPVTIGRPIANTRAYVLDQHWQCVPVGVVGELYLGGAGLARGYWARPELTATKFIPDSFSETGGGRLYRTGDLARYLENGELEFLGRADHQVKVRGYRIELGEIESELRQHEAVQEVVVVARAEAGEATRLVAYVVSATTISSAELRDRLRQRLPEYMVPSAFVQLTELPLTPNGKVDRKALPEPERITSESARYVAARTPLEELIAGIWMEVLGLEKVSTQENFFELGGHSLLATRVISRVRALGQVELPLRTLFESPTVAGLARRVEEAQRTQRGQTVVARIEPVERREIGLPLSFAQQRLWFLDQLEAGSAAYNIPAALRLRGELDQKALARTLTEIVRRHEVLRTSFTTHDGEPVQLIAVPEALALPVEDLSQLAEAEREAEAWRLTEAEAQTPFNLEYGPLLRARLLRLEEEEHMLLLTMHHIVSDGWSMSVLLSEAQQLYHAYQQGQESPLPELEMQYGDFSVWQRGYLTDAVLEEQLQYWREQLHDLPPVLNLPTDHARPAVQSMRGNAETRTLSATLTQGLKELSRARGATLYMTLLASFQTLLTRYSGQRDIVVGSPVANRTRVEVENLIGFFVNTLVLRAKFDDDPTFAELLDQVRTSCLDAYMHQDVPFEKLVEELAPERSLSHTPIFQVMFVMQNLADQPSSSAALSGLQLQVVESENRSAKFDLTLVMKESGDRLAASLEYNTDLFEATTMHQLLEQFEDLLNSIVSQPELPVSRLALLGREEEEQLLREWNDTQRDYEIAGGMHKLFEAQVEQTPAATALICGDERLSYSELNERANKLAHYLVESGVKAEDRIGILLERRATMVISLLGVLKAGGCYVPLDPQYPQERLEFMRADAGLRLLLTTRPLAEACGLEQSQVVYVEDVESENTENLSVEISGQQLAYLIYTSGSTGVPKGVAITHGNATTFIDWASEVFDQAPLNGVLFGTSICFDLSIFELFVTLSNGGKVILVDNVLQLTSLPEQVAAEVTLVNTVPSAMAELLRLGAVPPSVAVVNLAGEALRPDLVAAIYANTQVQQVYNLYGPSEDTTYSTYTYVPAGERVTIGRPIANTRAYVLDEQLQIVRVGVVGELYLGGEGLARGYWQRPELTATKFIPDHVSGEAGARLYRTGDLARYLVNGELEFLGRADQQVKIRGYRIELGEVESALRRQEQIRDAIVIAHEARGEQRLVAYVVMAASAAFDVSGLRNALQKQLPEYMTPAVFVQLDQLPLTPNGKVNRKALPEPEDSHADALETYIAPRNLIELQLARIWEELFRVEPIGVKDNFFELGGHSLLAVRLISRVKQELGKTVPLTAVFQEPTIEHLAGLLSQDDRDGRTSRLVQLHAGSKPPLVFVHPAGGGVFSYLSLVQYLENDQPLYALQASGLDQGQSSTQTVEEMAADYVAELREKLSGPYFLGGWSMGGVIAFEMARQLEAAGEEVGLLTLIDSFATRGKPDTDVNEVALSLGFAQDLGLRSEHVDDTSMSQFIDMNVDERLSFILQQATRQHLVPPDVELEDIARYFNVYCANTRAMGAYVPRTQDVRLALFRADEQPTPANNILPWQELVTEDFETHVVPGNHYTVLREPNVRVLAEHLRTCLARATADRGAKVS